MHENVFPAFLTSIRHYFCKRTKFLANKTSRNIYKLFIPCKIFLLLLSPMKNSLTVFYIYFFPLVLINTQRKCLLSSSKTRVNIELMVCASCIQNFNKFTTVRNVNTFISTNNNNNLMTTLK